MSARCLLFKEIGGVADVEDFEEAHVALGMRGEQAAFGKAKRQRQVGDDEDAAVIAGVECAPEGMSMAMTGFFERVNSWIM